VLHVAFSPIDYLLRSCLAQVEVGPGSFQKVRLLGKGDVGKVYLVKEKKTDKLFAMKGLYFLH
jgi:serine/threonine protein kinase